MLDGFFSNVLSSLVTKLLSGTAKKREARALIDLLALELRHNIALIDTLRLEEGQAQWTAAAAAIASRIRADVLNMVFLPHESNQAFRKQVRDLPLPEEDDSGQRPFAGDALESLWVRIRTVQALGGMGTAPEGMKDIRLRQRLTNLRDTMIVVVQSIHSSARPG